MVSRRLGLVAPLAVLGTAAVTAGCYLVGPASSARRTSASLYDPGAALSEPTDRMILVGWFALAIALACVFAFRVPAARRPGARRDLVVTIGAGAAMSVAIASVTWAVDITGLWGGIALAGLFTGLIGAVFLIAIPLLPVALARAGTVLTAGLALAYAIPPLVQTPSSMRDLFHYPFTSDEMVAVATGHFPLGDYIPQYTNLLGFPIAPLLHWFPEKSELVVLAWILLLQLVSLAIAVALPVLVGGRRHLGPAMIVAWAPPVTPMIGGLSASTYFAVLPIRVVLPATAILAAYLALRDRPATDLRRPARLLSVGAVAGLAALNNPDYGLPALVTALVVVFLVGRSLRSRCASTAVAAVGGIAVFGAYGVIGALAGRPVDWSGWLAFQNAFGAEGLASVAMEPFGPHVAVVGLFVTASVLGFVLIVRSRSGSSSFAYRQGLLLALTGGWALLTLPYFTGRSLVPTLIGGYTFAIGLVVAALLPLLHHAVRAIRAGVARDMTAASIGLAFGGLAVACVIAMMASIPAPSEYLSRQLEAAGGRSEPLRQVTGAVHDLLAEPANSRLAALVDDGVVAQSLDLSGLLELTMGLPSLSVTSSPAYYTTSAYFVEALCAAPWPDGVDYLLVSSAVADRISGEASCGDTFDLASRERFRAGDVAYVLLPHSSGTGSSSG